MNAGNAHAFKSGMQSCLQAYSNTIKSTPSSAVLVSFHVLAFPLLSDCISTFIWLFTKCITCAVLRFLPLGEAILAGFSKENREEQIPLHCSTAVQSSGQQLCRLPACQNTSLPCKLLCFLTLLLFPSILSEQKAVWKKKKGLFSLFQNSAFETVWAHADRGNAMFGWIYDYRVRGLGFPSGGFLLVWGGLYLVVTTDWVVIARNWIGRTEWFP